MKSREWIAVGVGATLSWSAAAQGPSVSNRGFLAAEYSALPRYEENPRQVDRHFAGKLQWESTLTLSERVQGSSRLFAREDLHNDDRDELRFDELWLQYTRPSWDVRVGNQLITWGSVESVSPLDIINPRDYEEDIVEPIKIGVPAVRLRGKLHGDDLSLYWLPYYEPSVFAGPRSYYSFSGGLRPDYPNSEWKPKQWAVRYFHTGEGFDVGLSWVHALERNAGFDLSPAGDALIGHTFASERYGLELTKVVGQGVLKSEVVYRTSDEPGNREAWLYAVGGEYSWMSVWRLSDLMVFAEYLGSSDNVADKELMQNDLFAALRWTLNDLKQQQLQAGVFWDMDSRDERVFRLEYKVSPTERVDLLARYTFDRNYYPAPRHEESTPGVFYLQVRFHF